jgi:hypothetical protein
MADWNLPTVTTNYALVFTENNGKFEDSAKMFDGSTSTNIPTGAYRIKGTGNNELEKWSGSSWDLQNLKLGTVTATSFSGPSTQIAAANEATDTTCFPLFVTAATGNLAAKTNTTFTFNSNTGAVGIGGLLEADNARLNAPSDSWSTDGWLGHSHGNIATQGSYELSMTCNGYRNSSSEWTSLDVNGYAGAAQINLNPQGFISFCTEVYKPNGRTPAVTERMRIASDGNITMEGNLTVNGNLNGFYAGRVTATTGTGTVGGSSGFTYSWSSNACTITHGLGSASNTVNATITRAGSDFTVVADGNTTNNFSLTTRTGSSNVAHPFNFMLQRD